MSGSRAKAIRREVRRRGMDPLDRAAEYVKTGQKRLFERPGPKTPTIVAFGQRHVGAGRREYRALKAAV